MCIRDSGNGAVLYLPFAFGHLLGDYGLPAHLRLLENMADLLLMNQRAFRMKSCPGLEAVLYSTEHGAVLHLVNSVGRRPLMRVVPLTELEFELQLPDGVKTAAVNVLLAVSYTHLDVYKRQKLHGIVTVW